MTSSFVVPPATLSDRLLEFQFRFMSALQRSDPLDVHADELACIENNIAAKHGRGMLGGDEASIAHSVVSNVSIMGSKALQVQRLLDDSVAQLTQEFDQILLNENRTHGDYDASSQRLTFPPSCLPPPVIESSCPSYEVPAIRQWFTSNLFYPYPTIAEKQSLATETNLSIKKVASNLCNLRRRSGWQALITKYCNGDRDEAHKLFRRIQSGQESRKEVLEAVEKVREYANRTLVVRDWVPEVARSSKSSTYHVLSVAPALVPPTHTDPTTAIAAGTTAEDLNTVERVTTPPQRSFSNSSNDSADSTLSSLSAVSTSIPSTPDLSIIYPTISINTSPSLFSTPSAGNKRSLNPEADEFVPCAKRSRTRFDITEPEPQPQMAYDPFIFPSPSDSWATPPLSQPLWMGMGANQRELSIFSDITSPSPSSLSPPSTNAWETLALPTMPASSPLEQAQETDATFMSIFGLDTVEFEGLARASTPGMQ